MSSQIIQPQPLASVSIKQILFATDFTPSCVAALPWVRSIARQYGATVYITHVLPPAPHTSVPMDVMSEELVQTRRNAEIQMKQFLSSDLLNGIQHATMIERGEPTAVIEAAVKAYEIDLVVVGTHGRGGVSHLFAGSVAETIFRDVKCPVLTVGPGAHARGIRNAPIDSIIFATDFSVGSLHALPYAISMATQGGAALTLLHACNDIGTTPYLFEQEIVEAQKKLATLVPSDVALAHKPQCVVTVGSPADGIIKAAESKQAHLIVMGAHRAKWASTHVPWAVAHMVAATAPCPVLTVRS
jgi:nucleotide-binding universal stress UspA family protein